LAIFTAMGRAPVISDVLLIDREGKIKCITNSSKLVAALRDAKGRGHHPWHSRIVGLIVFAVAVAAYLFWIKINGIDVLGIPNSRATVFIDGVCCL